MGRRKQAPRSEHRAAIGAAAQKLFMEKGTDAVSMDHIAQAAGYSKATLYVYFENKEEIVSVLVLDSMRMLREYISSALEQGATTGETYRLLCRALLKYQEEFPYYFGMALDRIRIPLPDGLNHADTKYDGCDERDEDNGETFLVGEQINRMLERFFTGGISDGSLRGDLKPMPTIFSLWGMLSGLILMAEKKAEYIQMSMNLSKQEFLEYGFSMLYQSIAVCGKEREGNA